MNNKLPTEVVVREVGPRDGLQMEDRWIETEAKIKLINLLSKSGLKRIEATSFVHPKAIPQMRDAAEVMAAIERVPGVRYEAIVPNAKGAERAVQSGVDQIGIFISATESHNQANVRMPIADSLKQIRGIVEIASAAGVPVRGSVVVAFGCPYEGDVSLEQILRILRRYEELGIQEILLGDTTGIGNPVQVGRTVRAVQREFGDLSLTLHFHDTRGTGLANVLAGLEAGVLTYDSSIGGLGGCPYAPGATGNIVTEDVVYMLEEMGVATGVDLDALLECARYTATLVDRELPSHVLKAGKRTQLAPRP
ncbi:MAG: hydroxymethylglutaryl-CoA lyase [Nitrospinota bacterium]